MPNFYYAAYSYLDEWMAKDKKFYDVLAFDKSSEVDQDKGRAALLEVATYYRVIRTLPRASETPRLETAYHALQAIQSLDEDTVVETVEAYTKTLADTYQVKALSAASKFLWMRFRSPVIIYDSIGSEWLCKNGGYNGDGYAGFCRAWRSNYQEHKGEIEKACYALPAIREFTLAFTSSKEELEGWVSSEWFMHRVFDHFMQNSTLLD